MRTKQYLYGGSLTHNVASHAMPTSEPVGQPLMRCQRPEPSEPLLPLHCENNERRESNSAPLQGTFHGRAGSGVDGQLICVHVQNFDVHVSIEILRWVLDLKLHDSKANIECGLQTYVRKIGKHMYIKF
jgi:hypothetical protein